MSDEKEQGARVLKACEFPTTEDLDWMESHIQRHTMGFDVWWQELCSKHSGRDIMEVILGVWEGSRGGKKTGFDGPKRDTRTPDSERVKKLEKDAAFYKLALDNSEARNKELQEHLESQPESERIIELEREVERHRDG